MALMRLDVNYREGEGGREGGMEIPSLKDARRLLS